MFSSTLLNFYYAIQGAVTRGKCAPSGVRVTNRWYRKRPGHTYINALMTRIILLEREGVDYKLTYRVNQLPDYLYVTAHLSPSFEFI